MPSRHEGFGLVALEAISAGVPVLISRESGLGRALREVVVDAERSEPREILPVAAPIDETAEIWGDALYEILVDPEAAFQHAQTLRREIAEEMRWDLVAQQILEALGYEPSKGS
jgi:glycosyltransferase involved in cell wall biosynthesis